MVPPRRELALKPGSLLADPLSMVSFLEGAPIPLARNRSEVRMSAEETARRREAVRRADAHNRIEGLVPSAAATAVYEEFIRGEIELDEVWSHIKAMLQRE